ncbi:VOC family protein [Stutzerimonas stutzeri]|jgi:predicted enzyme related to lactoylglutathione lyase|uniref:Lactoylglutathione lyase family protein n=1 Tax=Stutzerimonas stutzeri RCH2 TaxID=644801 RepID=L0GRX2_STUST|nr:VOC family protein [Stutzerimonas stutzeri]AGA88761.1 lactoylglutathione lyase family protein [Stutzerimonas stutzeri RCH2]
MEFLVNLDVDDLERAVDFYQSVFDLREGRRLGSFAVEMLGGPTPIYLLLKGAGSAATPGRTQQRSYERHWTPIHLDFVVTDIEAAAARAIAHGARLEQPITAQVGHKQALMADPFGHGFCLLQFTGGGYDELAN